MCRVECRVEDVQAELKWMQGGVRRACCALPLPPPYPHIQVSLSPSYQTEDLVGLFNQNIGVILVPFLFVLARSTPSSCPVSLGCSKGLTWERSEGLGRFILKTKNTFIAFLH